LLNPISPSTPDDRASCYDPKTTGVAKLTILVTGSAGHLGEAIVRSMRAANRKVVGLDVKPSPFTDWVGSIEDRGFVRHSLIGVSAIIHTATLHKPHLATHSLRDFVRTNVTGTRILLEEAVAAGVGCFVYTSTTSVFGDAMVPGIDRPAVWVTEELAPEPKNIYGLTKLTAEGQCELFHYRHRLPIVVLRTSRFFPEADDDAAIRTTHEAANVQANEMLYRRVDIEDAVSAHLLATEKAKDIGFARYIISATTSFNSEDLAELRVNARAVVQRMFPECCALYEACQWQLFPTIDRVYVNERAIRELDWRPKYDFRHVLASLQQNRDFRSTLARQVGSKGYHDRAFPNEPYPMTQTT
jgi:UDP-glucose 4-epimerase